MPETFALNCGRVVSIKGFHCFDTIEFLETCGVLTYVGSPRRWRQYIVDKAQTRMDPVWGKRKTIFVEDTEPEVLPIFKRLNRLPPWVVHVWLHSDRGIAGDPNYRSQLTLVFFRYDAPSSIEGVVADAIHTLEWSASAEDIPVNRWLLDDSLPEADDT